MFCLVSLFLEMISQIVLFPCWQMKKKVECYSLKLFCLPFGNEILLTNFVAILCDVLLVTCCNDATKRDCLGCPSA